MRRQRRIACLILVVGSGLGTLACGEDDRTALTLSDPAPVLGRDLPPEVEHPVTAAIADIQQAFVSSDYREVCAGITHAAALQAGTAGHGTPTTCLRNVRRMLEMIREGGGWRNAGKPRVIDVEVDGKHAVATVALERRWQARVPLSRVDGRWRLSGFFGTPPGRAQQIVEGIEEAAFPPSGPERVKVSDGDGTPCPDFSEAEFPRIEGGCRIRLRGRVAPLTIMTALGDFEFEDCSLDYGVRIDSSGRTWTEDFQVEGGPKSVACGDVNACYDFNIEELVPWRGRIHRGSDDSLVLRTDMCLRTCVGFFVGKLVVRLTRDGDGWRAAPVDGSGNSGFRFDNVLAVQGDVDVDAGG